MKNIQTYPTFSFKVFHKKLIKLRRRFAWRKIILKNVISCTRKTFYKSMLFHYSFWIWKDLIISILTRPTAKKHSLMKLLQKTSTIFFQTMNFLNTYIFRKLLDIPPKCSCFQIFENEKDITVECLLKYKLKRKQKRNKSYNIEKIIKRRMEMEKSVSCFVMFFILKMKVPIKSISESQMFKQEKNCF